MLFELHIYSMSLLFAYDCAYAYVCVCVVAQEMEDCHGGGVCLEVFVTMAGSLALLHMVKGVCVYVCVFDREKDKNRQGGKEQERGGKMIPI